MNNDLNDLIKRGAVCDMLHDEMGAWGSCADEIEALLKANDALWEIPAVDAVAVCRCKDCLHCAYDEIFGRYWCFGALSVRKVTADDFCSYGERKDGA